MKDTIVALATAPMKSALAIVRVSGDSALTIFSEIFSKNISKIETSKVFVGRIEDDGNTIDEVVAVVYKEPHSFTGENSVEIICHGSLLIANSIVELLIKHGARLAINGEYSSRAFMNGKIDLIQAEAINDVINASTRESELISMKALKGEASSLLNPIERELADLLAHIEANIDYPEETDIEVATKKEIMAICRDIIEKINLLIKSGKQGRIIKEGINLVIVGRPNVGKSSILNALLNQEKAIVTSIPGTTRDLIEGEFSYKGIVYHVVDTAGFHESDDEIEKIGMSKATKKAQEADIIIVVLNEDDTADSFNGLIGNKKTIVVYNKSDLVKNKDPYKIYISALFKDINPLLDEINKCIGISEDVFNNASLNNARQIGLLEEARLNLNEALRDAENDVTVDILFVNIMAAHENISAILHGEGTIIDLEKEIFSRFCVGK